MTIRGIDPQTATQPLTGCIRCHRDWPNAHFSREAEAVARGESPEHICDLCLEFAPDAVSEAIDEAQGTAAPTSQARMVQVLGIVSKSNLTGFEYQSHAHDRPLVVSKVTVEFKKQDGYKSIYVFYDVPVAVCEGWYAAPSKGSFFAEQIKSSYRCEKVK